MNASRAPSDDHRVAATVRPTQRLWGVQRWRRLLFLHWFLPAEPVAALLPPGLTLDTWEGQALVGVVPFVMEDIRLAGFPRAFGMDFLETNLRTYVHVDGADPGVFFFSLDADSRLAVLTAQLSWSLPYQLAKLTLAGEETRFGGEAEDVHYSLDRAGPPRARLDVRYAVGAPLPKSEPGSLQFFLVERYWLHLAHRGRLYSGKVHHRPYPLRAATVSHCDETLLAAAGLPSPQRAPELIHYSPGVDVEVFPLTARS